MTDTELCYLTLADAARLVRARKVSPVELTCAVLARIEATQSKTNAFIAVMGDEALGQAKKAERAIARGNYLGSLHGIPVSVKDIYDMSGYLTTCGSRVLHDNMAKRDATAVTRLKQAGAVIVGKNNMTEFAVELPSPVYGSARNPWDTERSPGLSSSGSGAAVTAGASFASLGTDTGGSIRLPAAFCGCAGIKPTYGRVSRHGVFPLSWSLDHAGPLARTVRDCAIVLETIAGLDDHDATSSERAVPNYQRALKRDLRGVKVGLPKEHFFDLIDTEIGPVVQKAIAVLRELGAKVREVSIPGAAKTGQAVGGIIRVEQAAAHEKWLRTRGDLYGGTLGDRLRAAALVPAVAYLEAQRLRQVITDDFNAAVREVDVLVTPSTPILPYKITEQPKGGAGEGTAIARFTMPYDLTGMPAISIPCGFAKGLPVGLQIAGRAFDESTVFRVAHAYEQATEWRKKRPSV
ncbi:MAG: hypothetical protein HY261_08340 [Chloroflexi bacterium]|nr:hypothetical protein [Chloroflexota bacterium]